MRVRKLATHRHIPGNWHEHIVTVWQEDDACRAAHDDTREQLGPSTCRNGAPREGAWVRITGSRWQQPAYRHHDGGDVTYTLFAGGWVRIESYDGSALGVALTITGVPE